MLPSIEAGRRLSSRATLWQLVATAVLAAGCLLKGPVWSLAAGAGGLAVVSGGLVLRWAMLGGGVGASALVLARMLAGMVLKWGVVIGVLVIAVVSGLPPLPLLAGAFLALVVQVPAMAGAQGMNSRIE